MNPTGIFITDTSGGVSEQQTDSDMEAIDEIMRASWYAYWETVAPGVRSTTHANRLATLWKGLFT